MLDHAAYPPPPAVSAQSIPERMAAVMRANRIQGQPTTRDDFHQALETCDLSDAELDANIGAAKRLVDPEVVRHDQPPRPGRYWNIDPDYRRERVTRGAALVTRTLPGDDVAVAALLSAGYCAAEIADLWSEIMAEAGPRHPFGMTPPADLATAIGRARAMDAVREASQ